MGSLPEIVKSDVGWLGDNEQQIADVLNSKPEFSPQYCHEYAVECFNARIMAKAYLQKYEHVLNGDIL
jgi:hypothetical protein